MKKKIIAYASNGALLAGLFIGLYVLADIYLIKGGLSSGTCPVVRNKPLLYAAIALCGISFFLSFFDRKDKGESQRV